jgi:hypothetical protein
MRNVTYEKSKVAKIFFFDYLLENQRFRKIPRASVRQTRTRSGTCNWVFFDK